MPSPVTSRFPCRRRLGDPLPLVPVDLEILLDREGPFGAQPLHVLHGIVVGPDLVAVDAPAEERQAGGVEPWTENPAGLRHLRDLEGHVGAPGGVVRRGDAVGQVLRRLRVVRTDQVGRAHLVVGVTIHEAGHHGLPLQVDHALDSPRVDISDSRDDSVLDHDRAFLDHGGLVRSDDPGPHERDGPAGEIRRYPKSERSGFRRPVRNLVFNIRIGAQESERPVPSPFGVATDGAADLPDAVIGRVIEMAVPVRGDENIMRGVEGDEVARRSTA